MALLFQLWSKRFYERWVDYPLEVAGDNFFNTAYIDDHDLCYDKELDHYIIVGFPKPGLFGKASPYVAEDWQEWRVYHLNVDGEKRLDGTFSDPDKAWKAAVAYHEAVHTAKLLTAKKAELRNLFRAHGAIPMITGSTSKPRVMYQFDDGKKVMWVPALQSLNLGLWVIMSCTNLDTVRFTQKHKQRAAKEFLRRHPKGFDGVKFFEHEGSRWMLEAYQLAQQFV